MDDFYELHSLSYLSWFKWPSISAARLSPVQREAFLDEFFELDGLDAFEAQVHSIAKFVVTRRVLTSPAFNICYEVARAV